MRSTVTVLAIVFAVSASGAHAQESQPLVPGSRLRATVSDSTAQEATLQVLRGALVRWENERLLLREDARGETLAVSLARVTRLEVSRGLHGHAAAGAAIGLVTGVAIGVPIGLAGFEDQKDDLLSIGSSGQWALGFGAAFGVLGAVVGSLVGSAHKSEQWELIPTEQLRGRLGVRSQPGGALLAFGLDL